MSINDMRAALIKRYGPVIQGKKVDNMEDDQVAAIYHRLIESKDPFINKSKVPRKMRLHKPVKCEQIKMEI